MDMDDFLLCPLLIEVDVSIIHYTNYYCTALL